MVSESLRLPAAGPSPADLEAARELVDQLGFVDNPGEPFKTSRGITLQAISAPPHLIADVELAFPEPPAPMVEVKRSGVTVSEQNPTDPAFLAEHEAWKFRLESARQRALFACALEVVEIPVGEKGPEDNWDRELVDLPIEIPAPKKGGRRLAWLIYYVLVNSKDIGEATRRCVRMVGLSEGDVAYMARLFPRDEEGPATES